MAPQSLLPLWHLVQQMELFREWGYFPWGHKLSLFSLTPREGTSPVTPEGYIPTTAGSTWGKNQKEETQLGWGHRGSTLMTLPP